MRVIGQQRKKSSLKLKIYHNSVPNYFRVRWPEPEITKSMSFFIQLMNLAQDFRQKIYGQQKKGPEFSAIVISMSGPGHK